MKRLESFVSILSYIVFHCWIACEWWCNANSGNYEAKYRSHFSEIVMLNCAGFCFSFLPFFAGIPFDFYSIAWAATCTKFNVFFSADRNSMQNSSRLKSSSKGAITIVTKTLLLLCFIIIQCSPNEVDSKRFYLINAWISQCTDQTMDAKKKNTGRISIENNLFRSLFNRVCIFNAAKQQQHHRQHHHYSSISHMKHHNNFGDCT